MDKWIPYYNRYSLEGIMLPGVQITIVVIVAILLFGSLGSMIWLLVDLGKDRRERKTNLSEKEVDYIIEKAKKEFLKQRDDNIHTNS